MNKTLLEARGLVEQAILEADREPTRGGHRHWWPYASREDWLRTRRLGELLASDEIITEEQLRELGIELD